MSIMSSRLGYILYLLTLCAYRLREILHQIRPPRVLPPRLTRRVYRVKGPNALWHLDSHHKLIRYKMVTHGAIDGHSRLIVYLQCNTNNFANTVMELFHEAVTKYGLPSRVRTDMGGENMEVWKFMIEVRGTDRGSYIAGPSVHNTRIERLWRDLNEQVISIYSRMFAQMEEDALLNPASCVDIFCLHLVFLPHINMAINTFVDSWNCHQLRTENNRTPQQIYCEDSLLYFPDQDVLRSVNWTEYGQDPTGNQEFVTGDSYVNIINIPSVNVPLTPSQLQDIQCYLNSLTCSSLIEAYAQTLTHLCVMLEAGGYELHQ